MEAMAIALLFSWQLWLTALSFIERDPMPRVVFRSVLLLALVTLIGCERSSPFGKPDPYVNSREAASWVRVP